MPDLGKYGVEVLSAYGATVFFLVVLVWATWVRSVKMRKALDAAEARKSKNG